MKNRISYPPTDLCFQIKHFHLTETVQFFYATLVDYNDENLTNLNCVEYRVLKNIIFITCFSF